MAVLAAADPALARPVAIKLLRPLLPLASDFADRFGREATIVARLRHAHIVPVFDSGLFEGSPYLVMELVAGRTLDDELQESAGRALDFRRTAELISKMAEALHFAHERGIIHRDVKPSNILLDERCEPQLTDFGLAAHDVPTGLPSGESNTRSFGAPTGTLEGPATPSESHRAAGVTGSVAGFDRSLTRTHQTLGTPAYMSPEQAAGRAGDADARSDVFSLGIILYRMLTGQRPFQGETDAELRDQILRTAPPRPRGIHAAIPGDLETVCLKALEKSPAARYRTARHMAAELRRWLDDLPLVVTPPGRLERFRRLCLRHRVLTALTVFSVILALLSAWAMTDARIRRRETTAAEGAREETRIRELLVRGHEQLQLPRPDRARYARETILPELAQRRGRLPGGVPRADLDRQVRSLLVASLSVPELRILGEIELPNSQPNTSWVMALHPSGAHAALASDERPFRIDAAAPRVPSEPIVNPIPRPKLAFSPNGKWLAFAPGRGGLEVWNGSVTRRIGCWTSPGDGDCLTLAFLPSSDVIQVCVNNGTVLRLSVPELSVIERDPARTECFPASPTAAVFSNDCSRIAVGDAMGQVLIARLDDADAAVSLNADSQRVDCLRWSPDDRLLAVGLKGGLCDVFDVPRRTRIMRLVAGFSGIENLAFSPDGIWLATAHRGAPGGRIWEVASGRLALVGDSQFGQFSDDATMISGTGAHRAVFYRMEAPTVVRHLAHHESNIERLTWSPDGSRIASIDTRFVLLTWDVANGRICRTVSLATSETYFGHNVGVALSRDGWLAVVSPREGESRVLAVNLEDGQEQTWRLAPGIDTVAWIGQGRFVSIRQESTDGHGGRAQTMLREFVIGEDMAPPHVLRTVRSDESGFFSQQLTVDGRYYVWTGPRQPRSNCRTEFWDVPGRRLLCTIPHPGSLQSAEDPAALCSDDGRTLWTSDGIERRSFDLTTREDPSSTRVATYPSAVSFDGRWSVKVRAFDAWLSAGRIALVDQVSGTEWLSLSSRDGSGSAAEAVQFSPDGRWLAWGSHSGEITVVDLQALQKEVAKLEALFRQ